MRSNRRESEVLAGVLAYLGVRGDSFFWRSNTAALVVSGRFLRFGVPGAPDVFAVQAPTGRLFGIECKRESGGVLSRNQKRWGAMLEAHGGVFVVARGFDDVAVAMGPVVRVVDKTQFEPKRVVAR